MGERTSYPPGTFSWAELATSDAGAAKSFYSTLFGWDYEDNPIGDGQVYSMASRGRQARRRAVRLRGAAALELLCDGRVGRRGDGPRR